MATSGSIHKNPATGSPSFSVPLASVISKLPVNSVRATSTMNRIRKKT